MRETIDDYAAEVAESVDEVAPGSRVTWGASPR
jgi:hypothetical protein